MLPAAVRLVHPAPALAVIVLSTALAAILASQTGRALDARLVLVVLGVAGSQIATGAINDWADRKRDLGVRPEKPIPAGEVSPSRALAIGVTGMALVVVASVPLGPPTLLLASGATLSAIAYDLRISRTPASVIPYLVSFGILPLWIAAGIEVPLARVAPAALLVAPFAAAAHLANTARDFDLDARTGATNLAQVLGRHRSQQVALALALGVGLVVALALGISGQLRPLPLGLGLVGLVAIGQGADDAERLWYGMLVAAVCWTASWALATG